MPIPILCGRAAGYKDAVASGQMEDNITIKLRCYQTTKLDKMQDTKAKCPTVTSPLCLHDVANLNPVNN